MASIKASQQGLAKIKLAIDKKSWKVNSDRPLLEASKVLEPQKKWHKLGPYANGSKKLAAIFTENTDSRSRSARPRPDHAVPGYA